MHICTKVYYKNIQNRIACDIHKLETNQISVNIRIDKYIVNIYITKLYALYTQVNELKLYSNMGELYKHTAGKKKQVIK